MNRSDADVEPDQRRRPVAALAARREPRRVEQPPPEIAHRPRVSGPTGRVALCSLVATVMLVYAPAQRPGRTGHRRATPRCRVPPPRRTPPADASPPVTQRSPRRRGPGRHPRPSLQQLLHLSLGLEVDVAEDGAEGPARCSQQRPYSLVITDLRMPKLDGMKLIEEIHEAEAAGHGHRHDRPRQHRRGGRRRCAWGRTTS